MEYLMEYLIVVIVYGVIWGYVCAKVVENKGYEVGNWHIWGFVFGIFAFLVAATKPDISSKKYSDDDENSMLSRLVKEDETKRIKQEIANGKMWECPSCKKANMNYITTCTCGVAKPMANITERVDLEKWQCVNCGTSNTINFAICKCGMKKSENDKRIAAGDVWKNIGQEKEERDSLEILKKYKELLDMDAITQEEYDKKKKEII